MSRFQVGQRLLEHNHRFVTVVDYAFCKNQNCDLPIIEEDNTQKRRFAHPNNLRPIPEGQLEILGYEKIKENQTMAMATRNPNELRPHPLNAQIYDVDSELEKQQIEELKSLIEKTGIIYPVTINENDEIIKGHRRTKVAKLLGMEVPVIVEYYQSPEDEFIALLSDNATRHLSTEQSVREALAWQKMTNLAPPKGVKSRDWLGQRAGMSGMSFADAKKVVEAIDLFLEQGLTEVALSLRNALNQSILSAKNLLKTFDESQKISWIYRYVGEGLVTGSLESYLCGGDLVTLANYKIDNPTQVSVVKVGGKDNEFFAVYYADLDVSLKIVEDSPEYYRERNSFAIVVPESPSQKRFLIRCDNLDISMQLHYSNQRLDALLKIMGNSMDEALILRCKKEHEREFALQQQLVGGTEKNKPSQPEVQQEVEVSIPITTKAKKSETKTEFVDDVDNVDDPETKSTATLNKNVPVLDTSLEVRFSIGDRVKNTISDEIGTITDSKTHKVGKPGQRTQVLKWAVIYDGNDDSVWEYDEYLIADTYIPETKSEEIEEKLEGEIKQEFELTNCSLVQGRVWIREQQDLALLKKECRRLFEAYTKLRD